jgi:ABC-type branched-subunit amino acid transport system substrate-binding protein
MSKDLDPYGFEVYVTFPAPDVLDNTLTQTEGLEHLRNLIKQQGHQSYEIFGYDALQLIAQAILESRKDGISRVSLINTLASKPEFSGAGFNYRFENGENIKSNYYLYNVTSKSFQLLNADEIRKFKSEIKVRQ